MSNMLGMFVKYPEPGRVKTRLAEGVGSEAAADLYAAFVDDTVARFSCIADSRILGYAPNNETAGAWARATAGESFQPWCQPETDLGRRMNAFFEHAFASGASRALLVGSDSPNLPISMFERAFAVLNEKDVVIGPASDGGYYLIGQRDHSRDLFQETEWSTAQVFEQTLVQVRKCEASLGLLPPWYDIDTTEEARMLAAHLSVWPDPTASQLPRTMGQLSELFDLPTA